MASIIETATQVNERLAREQVEKSAKAKQEASNAKAKATKAANAKKNKED